MQSMKKQMKIIMATAAVGIFGIAASAPADPFVNFSIVARPTNQPAAAFSNVITGSTGESVTFELMVAMAPVGNSNTNFNGNANHQITSLTYNSESTSGDGLNNTKLNLGERDPNASTVIDFSSATTLNPTPVTPSGSTKTTGWGDGTQPSGGTVATSARANGGHDLTAIRPIHSAGVQTAVTQEIMLTGTFTLTAVPAGAPAAFLDLSYFSGQISTGKVNGGSSFVINNTSELSTQPYFAYAQLEVDSTPEPTSLSLLGLGGVAMLRRRRTSARKGVVA